MAGEKHPALLIENLAKIYRLGLGLRVVSAVDGLSLKIGEGSIFGFVGPNGAGKSTTIKMLVGLIAPTQGSATIFGRPIREASSREAIGYLPENPSFHDFLKPLEVLSFMGRLSGLSGKHLVERSHQMLKMVGLDHAQDLTVRKFSKGMVQRLGIAQAMMHDPPLLILDEPMSGLDPIGRKEVRDLILELRRRGKTIFFSTHILNDVETICDRVGMILHGRLVAEGALNTLLDGSIRSVDLRCTGLPAEVFSHIRPLAADGIQGTPDWTFSFADVANANMAATKILGAGGRILSLQPNRETLEETFVRLAQADRRSEVA